MSKVTFINVGYGEAILIEHEGRRGLIDGGSGLEQEFVDNRISLKEYLKKQRIDTLDFVLLTHIHEDHVGGIVDIMEEVAIQHFYFPYEPAILEAEDIVLKENLPFNLFAYTTALNGYRQILAFAHKQQIPTTNIAEHRSIAPFGEASVTIDILEPTKQNALEYSHLLEQVFAEDSETNRWELITQLDRESNDYSIVANLLVAGHSFILTGDNCPENWGDETFISVQNGNVLKLPHHGQPDAINPILLDHLGVEYVVTSTSGDRRNNSANYQVYEQILQINSKISCLFTDEIEYPPFFIGGRTNPQALVFLVNGAGLTVIV